MTVTTAEDIGALTAQILLAEPRIVNEVVYTAGDTLTYERLADTVDAVLGRKGQPGGVGMPTLEEECGEEPGDPIQEGQGGVRRGPGCRVGAGQDLQRTSRSRRRRG